MFLARVRQGTQFDLNLLRRRPLLPEQTIMGKRSKVMKALSPPRPVDYPADSLPDDDLVDDLMAQLDAKDTGTSKESAAILQDISEHSGLDKDKDKAKKDPKSRWRARQVRVYAPVS
jgi:hypothetical protein